MKSKNKKPICKCPECGKIVSAKIPKGGDGSMWVPYRHKDNEGKLCSGRFEGCKLISVIE